MKLNKNNKSIIYEQNEPPRNLEPLNNMKHPLGNKENNIHPSVKTKTNIPPPHTHTQLREYIRTKKLNPFKNGQIFGNKMLVVKCNLIFFSSSIFLDRLEYPNFHNTGIRIV